MPGLQQVLLCQKLADGPSGQLHYLCLPAKQEVEHHFLPTMPSLKHFHPELYLNPYDNHSLPK